MNSEQIFNIYQPSKTLSARITRRVVKHIKQRHLQIKTKRPIVSFSFDDCPRSVFENALPELEIRDWAGTIYAAMGLCETTNHLGLHMSKEDIKSAFAGGHEIGDHTFSHRDVNSIPTETFMNDVQKNQQAFKALGLPKAETFAFPYGEVSLATKQALSKEFGLLRGIHSPRDYRRVDCNQAPSQSLYSGRDFENCRKAIFDLKNSSGWLIFFTHDVRDNPSAFGCTPEEFTQILKDVAAIDAEVLPVGKALRKLKGMVNAA